MGQAVAQEVVPLVLDDLWLNDHEDDDHDNKITTTEYGEGERMNLKG